MKKLLLLLLLLFSVIINAQTVTYTPDYTNFTNPERGLYYYTKAKSTSYSLLTVAQLNGYKATNKISTIWRSFYIDAFKTTPISASYLANMQTDFNTMRSAGVKCIIRFNYSDVDDIEASKTQILSHIDQLKPVLQANEDVISSLEAGFIGKYGEWYYSSNFGTGTLTAQNLADRKEIGLAIMSLCPNRMVAFRTPTIQRQIGGNTPISLATAYDGSINSRVSAHNDCFLASGSDYGTYINTTTDYDYLAAQSLYTFDGGELCNLSTYSTCLNAFDKMAKFHFNYLNTNYNVTVWDDLTANGCYDEIVRRLGYRFEMIDSNISNNTLTLRLKNVGFSNVFNNRNVYIVLKNTADGITYSFKLNTDIKFWGAGTTVTITDDLMSHVVPFGNYELFLNIPDKTLTNTSYSIQMANLGVYDSTTGYNRLGQTIALGIPLTSCGGTTTTWNGSAWSNGVPTLLKPVIINGNYNTSINGTFSCCNLTVNPAYTLNISSGQYVSVVNEISVNGQLIVNDKGKLVQVNDSPTIINTGSIKSIRTTTPYEWADYTYWSSPVKDLPIGTPLGTWYHPRTMQFYSFNWLDKNTNLSNGTIILDGISDGFDDNTDAWTLVNQTDIMKPGVGYAVMANLSGAFPRTSTVTFEGVPNNGIINVPIYLDMEGLGTINLIGNPYPSPIFMEDFVNSNNDITGTIYYWSHKDNISAANPGSSQLNFTSNDYAMWNLVGGVGTGFSSISGSTIPTDYCGSHQGFLVSSITNGTVIFNNSMRAPGYSNSKFFRKTTIKDRYWLNLTSNIGLYSQQLIGYLPNTTLDYDRKYDGEIGKTQTDIKFYSFINDKIYKIQSRGNFNNNDVVKLGYQVTKADTYKITLENPEGIMLNQEIYIYDKLLNKFQNLKTPYSFYTEVGVFDDRFEIFYSNTLNTTSSHAKFVKIYVKDNKIQTNLAGLISKVFIYDLTGRLISNNIYTNDLSRGIYIIKIEVNKRIYTNKIYI